MFPLSDNKIGDQIHDLLTEENYAYLKLYGKVISFFEDFNRCF